jgi:hypothetical protein
VHVERGAGDVVAVELHVHLHREPLRCFGKHTSAAACAAQGHLKTAPRSRWDRFANQVRAHSCASYVSALEVFAHYFSLLPRTVNPTLASANRTCEAATYPHGPRTAAATAPSPRSPVPLSRHPD